MKSNILVIGGTGKTGRRVVEKLNQQDQNVRIGTRKNDPAFDWNDPSTYATALSGMDKAYIVYYPDLAVPGAVEKLQRFVELAKESGMKRIVLLSGRGEEEAERGERVVQASGLSWTIVRASWFSQNFSENFLLQPVQAGHVALSGSVYSATKWFIRGYAKNLSNELIGDGVRVTSIDPGMVETPFFSSPQPQALRPDDIANAFMYVVNLPSHARIAEIEINPTVGAHPA